MSRQITVPDLGDHVDQATFVAWLKEEGDAVHAGEPVAEVMTDKANIEVESPCDGVLGAPRCSVDDRVSPGQVLATIESSAAA